MGTFQTSTGERLTKAEINANIEETKLVLNSENEDKQYCWSCGTSQDRLTWSHIISVNKCQNDGRTEIAWHKGNMQRECLSLCHLQTEVRNISHHANYRYKKTYIENYYKNEPKSTTK